MIIVAGSKLVRDSQYVNDIDIVYLTFNLGKYVVLVKNRDVIGKVLSKKLGMKVTFSPYLPTHTLLGNLFLAITLSRYPKRSRLRNLLLRLAYVRRSNRWLLIHIVFAALGLLGAESRRDRLKYCSMVAENMLYALNIMVPNSWRKTVVLGYTISRCYGLNNLASLFHWCLSQSGREKALTKLALIMSAIEEYVREFVRLSERDFDKLIKKSLSNALRYAHVEFLSRIHRESLAWIECSRLLLLVLRSWTLRKTLRKQEFVERVLCVFKKCRNEIPVLSPMAHP